MSEGRVATASALPVSAIRAERPTRSRSRQATARRSPREWARREQRRQRHSRWDKSPPSSGPSPLTESKHTSSGASSDPSGADSTKSSGS